MQQIKKSTVTTLLIGPFVQAADGVTPITGLTLAGSAFTVASAYKVNAVALVSLLAEVWVEVGNGYYLITLDAAVSDTIGPLTLLFAKPASFRPVRYELMVLEANAFRCTVDGTVLPQVDVEQINGDVVAAVNLRAGADTMVPGAVAAGASTATAIITALVSPNNGFNGSQLRFRTGTNAGLSAAITAFNAATSVLTCSGFPNAPAPGDLFIIS